MLKKKSTLLSTEYNFISTISKSDHNVTMKLYTSYFANLKKITPISIPISISSQAPSWYEGKRYTKLAPKTSFLMQYKRGLIDSNEYSVQFQKQVLDILDAEVVYDDFKEYGNNVSLLCFERAGEFCHRRLVASWLESKLKISVPEFGYECTTRKLFT